MSDNWKAALPHFAFLGALVVVTGFYYERTKAQNELREVLRAQSIALDSLREAPRSSAPRAASATKPSSVQSSRDQVTPGTENARPATEVKRDTQPSAVCDPWAPENFMINPGSEARRSRCPDFPETTKRDTMPEN